MHFFVPSASNVSMTHTHTHTHVRWSSYNVSECAHAYSYTCFYVCVAGAQVHVHSYRALCERATSSTPSTTTPSTTTATTTAPPLLWPVSASIQFVSRPYLHEIMRVKRHADTPPRMFVHRTNGPVREFVSERISAIPHTLSREPLTIRYILSTAM